MNAGSVESDELLVAAGECFMFLLWSETSMCDLVVLKEGGEGMRRRYSRAYGKEPHPSDFSRRRLELGMKDFTEIKDRSCVIGRNGRTIKRSETQLSVS